MTRSESASLPTSEKPPRSLHARVFWCALVVLLVSIAVRIPWIGGTEPTTDEMLHLQSYRNRYDQGFEHPVTLRRIETHPRLSPSLREKVLSIYHSSTVFRFGLYLVNESSQVYGAILEGIRGTFGNHVAALRLPSLIFAGLSLWTLYLIGRQINGPPTGLMMMVLGATSPLVEIYGAMARGHIVAQFGLLLLTLAFMRSRSRVGPSRHVFLAALFAQLMHWGIWLAVFPFVVTEMFLIYRETGSIKTLIRRTWWYALISAVLVSTFIPLTQFTSGQNNLGFVGLKTLSIWYGVASPFGIVDALDHSGRAAMAAAVVWLVLMAGGAVALTKSNQPTAVKVVLVLSFVLAVVSSLLMCNGIRHLVIYMASFLPLTGLAVARLFRSPRAILLGAMFLFVALEATSLVVRDDPYRRVLDFDARYSEAAAYLREHVGPQDRWMGYPFFNADPLYPHNPPGEPINAWDDKMVVQAFETPGVRDIYVVMRNDTPVKLSQLQNPAERWNFGQRYSICRFNVESARRDASTAASQPSSLPSAQP